MYMQSDSLIIFFMASVYVQLFCDSFPGFYLVKSTNKQTKFLDLILAHMSKVTPSCNVNGLRTLSGEQ